MNTKEKIGKGFSSLSSSYIFLSRLFFGKSLLRSQFYFPSLIRGRHRVLLAGTGTGELLVKILELGIAKEITCVDISEGMIQQAKKLLAQTFPENDIPLKFICCPIQDLKVNEKYDLVLFPYLLDCLENTDIDTTLQNTGRYLEVNGQVILTDFRIPGKPFLARIYAKMLLPTLYLFFRLVCKIKVKRLPDFDRHFSENGFTPLEEKTFYCGILFTRVYSRR